MYSVNSAIYFSIGESLISIEEAKIPLLSDVFEKFPKIAINIDIKVDNDTLISKVIIYIIFTPFITFSSNQSFSWFG